MDQIIGTCGHCGGPVEVSFHSIDYDPHCPKCGSVPLNRYGPVIEMRNKTSMKLQELSKPIQYIQKIEQFKQ